MRYQVLMLNVPNQIYNALRQRFGGMDVDFITAFTPQQVSRLCIENAFHLIIVSIMMQNVLEVGEKIVIANILDVVAGEKSAVA